MAETESLKKKPCLGQNIDHVLLKKLPLVLRSKYQYYNQPSVKVGLAQSASRRRLRVLAKKANYEDNNNTYNSDSDIIITKHFDESLLSNDHERHERLIGQLKAAEARNRVRLTRLRYEHNRDDDISHLIQCQPTAVKAVRLEAFLADSNTNKTEKKNTLPPIERRRLEAMINDDIGLLFDRLL